MSSFREYDFVTSSPEGRVWIHKEKYNNEKRIAIVGEYPHDKVENACNKLISANYAILDYIKKRKDEDIKHYHDMQNELAQLVPKKGKTDKENLRIYEITHTTMPIHTGLPKDQIDKLNETLSALSKILN